MLRRCLLLFVLVTAPSFSAGGCRSCSSCHDYDPPVMGCEAGGCGRAGSACGGGSCGCGSCGSGESENYYEGEQAPPQEPEEPTEAETGA